jgi:ubiquinone biosynthesis protein
MNHRAGVTGRIGGMRRFAAITRILARHGLGELLDRTFRRSTQRPQSLKLGYPSPQRLRRMLEELGPSFIKLGQLMSTRADVFPPEYIEALTRLQDSVPPVPFDEIRQVMEKELKEPFREVFESFDETCMAAASVAQVHAARLRSGDAVAVKVIRPGIHKKIREDIGLMYYFAEKFDKSFELGRILQTVNLVAEFERTIFRELDMLIEAGNIERFAEGFKNIEEIRIPKVYWEHTSRSVLVMENMQGLKLDQVAAIRAHGIDPKAVAMIGLRSFSRQLMEVGLFHADPHPGNTIVMFDGRVSLVDFGIVGYLDEETMLQIAHVFLGYAEHDYDLIIDALEGAGLIDPDSVDVTSFRIDLKDISEPFYGRSLQAISVKDVYDQLMQLIYKYRIRLPRNLLLLLKTFIQTEALGKILGSDASLLEVTRPYARKLLQRGYDAQKILKNVARDIKEGAGSMRLVPKYIMELLRRTAGGRHRLELRHTGFDTLNQKMEKGINRLTVGLVISASIIAGSLILNSGRRIGEISIGFLGDAVVSINEVLGITGYSIATILGFWLIISILRSGKL